MVSTRKQIDVSGEELVGPLISEKIIDKKRRKKWQKKIIDAKIASLEQKMEKLTLMVSKLLEDSPRKPPDEKPQDPNMEASKLKDPQKINMREAWQRGLF